MRIHLRLLLVAGLALSLAACQSIGPGAIQRDRLDYGDAIASSWREQMLLNIVKLRYFDAPAFMEVSSVIGSYTLQSELGWAGRFFPSGRVNTYRNYSVTGAYSDRPTISYTPVTGQKYVEKLLRPIPPQAIFAMIQAGHSASYILSLTVRGFNNVINQSPGPAREGRQDPVFFELVDALQRLQQAGALGIRIEKRGQEEVTLLYFRNTANPEIERDVRFIREALDLNDSTREFRLVFGSVSRNSREIALLTRSMWEILAELSGGVEVPARDRIEGRATTMAPPDERLRPMPVARIHSGTEPPADAYIAVQYRDIWFWIDDRDLASKRVLTFLMVFSSIAETSAVPQVPVITLPAN